MHAKPGASRKLWCEGFVLHRWWYILWWTCCKACPVCLDSLSLVFLVRRSGKGFSKAWVDFLISMFNFTNLALFFSAGFLCSFKKFGLLYFLRFRKCLEPNLLKQNFPNSNRVWHLSHQYLHFMTVIENPFRHGCSNIFTGLFNTEKKKFHYYCSLEWLLCVSNNIPQTSEHGPIAIWWAG